MLAAAAESMPTFQIWGLPTVGESWECLQECTREPVALSGPDQADGSSSSSSILTHAAEGIRDIAWAPNMGKSFHQIATASSYGALSFWRMEIPLQDRIPTTAAPTTAQAAPPIATDSVPPVAMTFQHECTITGQDAVRVSWNLTGNKLFSLGQNQALSVWQRSFTQVRNGDGERGVV